MQSLPITINIVKVTRRYDGYNAIAARVLAALQLSLGAASIVFNACAMIHDETGFASIGYGIWLPVFWIISGAFGIAASFRKTKCLIITTMVMSILSASFMTIYVCLASIQMVQIPSNHYDYYYYNCDHDYDEYGYSTEKIDCHEDFQYAMGSMMLVVAVVETIVAILTAVLCCRAVCCKQPYTTLGEDRAQNLVVNTPSGAQTVSIPAGYQVTNQGATGQHVVDNTRNNPDLADDKPENPPPYTASTGY